MSSASWPSFFASSSPFLALAYAPKPGQQSYLGFPAVSPGAYSSDQILVSEPLASGAIDEAFDAPQVCRSTLPREPERELVNIPAEMLRLTW